MTIGVDIRVLLDAQYSGVAEYTLNLLRALMAEDKVNNYVLFYNSAKDRRGRLPEFAAPNVKIISRRWPNKALNYGFFKLFNWPAVDKLIGCQFDVYWLPHLNFLAWPKAKNLLTIHDLSFLRYKEFFSGRQNFWHRQLNVSRLLKQADIAVAISENTKRDIMTLIGVQDEKIKVIYSGVADNFKVLDGGDGRLLAVQEKYQLPKRFILFLGTVEPRKNLSGLIQSYNYLRQRHADLSDVQLIIAGGDGWKFKKIYQSAEISPYAADIKFLGYIKPDDKCALYNLAAVFAFPSFYEGFGLPPLEAMAAGTPVVASFASSMPEVVGTAGLLVDPYNAAEIGEAVAQVLLDKNLAEVLRQRGLAQAKKFTWQKTAQAYLKLFAQ